MQIIGLTGGIASGKTTIASILKEINVSVIDSDAVSRDLSQKGKEIWQALKEHFSDEYFKSNGELNRRALGDYVFSNDEARKTLNEITHPIIWSNISSTINTLEKELKIKFIVIEVPLLFESDWDKRMDETWVVSVPYDVQLERLIKRNNFTREQAQMRIKSQMSLVEKSILSDKVIDNSKSPNYTRKQVLDLIKLKHYGGAWDGIAQK